MALGIVRLQPEALHEREHQRHGSRDYSLTCSPAAHRAHVHVKEGGAPALSEPEGSQRGAEVVGGHEAASLATERFPKWRVISAVFMSDGPQSGFMDAHGATVSEAHGVPVARRGADRHGLSVNDGGALVPIGREARAEQPLNGDTLALGELVGHFDLHRAWAPFRTITSKADILPGVKRAPC